MLPKQYFPTQRGPRIEHQPIELLSYIIVLVGPDATPETTILPPVVSGAHRGTVDATWMWYLNLILDVQDQFSVTITDGDLAPVDTIADLARVVSAKFT